MSEELPPPEPVPPKPEIQDPKPVLPRWLPRNPIYYLGGLALLALLWVLLLSTSSGSRYGVDQYGFLHYQAKRPINLVSETFLNESEDSRFYEVVFDSKGQRVYGLLRLPSTASSGSPVPAAVVLPGAGRTKESEQDVGGVLASFGYASFTLDQRGVGATDGTVPTTEEDLQTFEAGGEPVQHQFIYDALKAFDYLYSRPEVNHSQIFFLGESMGGRFALIATALEPRVRGVVGISTSGYGQPKAPTDSAERFFRSIDPDTYVSSISPRPLAMFHSSKDSVVPIQVAQNTYTLARQSKYFFQASCNTHGYCEEMRDELKNWLSNNLR